MTDTQTRETNHISKLGMIVLIMAMLSLALVLWTSYQDRVETQCQKELNTRFLVVIKERANVSDGDRAAVRNLVADLVRSGSDEETQRAILKYDQANRELDRQRKIIEYPSPNQCK